jgi:hypothetical protein
MNENKAILIRYLKENNLFSDKEKTLLDKYMSSHSLCWNYFDKSRTWTSSYVKDCASNFAFWLEHQLKLVNIFALKYRDDSQIKKYFCKLIVDYTTDYKYTKEIKDKFAAIYKNLYDVKAK